LAFCSAGLSNFGHPAQNGNDLRVRELLESCLPWAQPKRPTCPNCGADLFLALPPDGKGQRKPQCFDCDGPDPLKTEQATGWLKSELQPPK
jgi:hypothetical protein